jgi:broad specificity phosphatase PhoE
VTRTFQDSKAQKSFSYLMVVRHGQTDFNLQRRFQGQLDVPLNDHGVMQSEKSATEILSLINQAPLKSFQSCRITSSDLKRASETARKISSTLADKSAMSTSLQFNKLLREQNTGALQGSTLAEFHDRHQAVALAYDEDMKRDPNFAKPPGEAAESKFDVAVRMGEFLSNLVASVGNDRKPELQILCGHGWAINVLLEMMNARDANAEGYIGNGDILVMEISRLANATKFLGKVDVGVSGKIVNHILVGERIGHLSFAKPAA